LFSLPKFAISQEQPGKTFLTRIEQLIDEVYLDADSPSFLSDALGELLN
jgi:hypothetical protein